MTEQPISVGTQEARIQRLEQALGELSELLASEYSEGDRIRSVLTELNEPAQLDTEN